MAKMWKSYGEEFPAEIFSDKFTTTSDLPTSTPTSTTSNPTQPGEEDPASLIESQNPNLPLSYWRDNAKGLGMALNQSCAKMPDLLNLRYNNLYWQEVVTSKVTLYLYGAYLDIRARNPEGPNVRLLGMMDKLRPKVKIYCQLWFENRTQPVLSLVKQYKYIFVSGEGQGGGNNPTDNLQPYLLTCPIPPGREDRNPILVSVVEHACATATTLLKITYNKLEEGEEKKKFAVCVKGLDIPDDLTVRLAEWIELVDAMGADMIFLYKYEVHPNVAKLLKHYSTNGKIGLRPITLPGSQPNLRGLQHLFIERWKQKKRLNELIPFNDCFYRNMYRYDWIALLDVDEVIVPRKLHTSWAEMMEEVGPDAKEFSNWSFTNIYFLDNMTENHPEPNLHKDIPPGLHIMNHVYRSANYTPPGHYIKCFHNSEHILALHNHFPRGCIGQACSSMKMLSERGHLQHYRKDCANPIRKTCKERYGTFIERDTTVWKWRKRVVANLAEVFDRLGIIL